MHSFPRRPIRFLTVILAALLLATFILAAPGSLASPDRSISQASALQQAASTPTPAPRTDNSSTRGGTNGTLIVGTSADYPPFAYYDRNFRLDGFDVALIREMARRMGLQVEIRDYAFDGLLGAVQLGQIDAAIAAISISPEREQVVDFTNVYYVSQDAMLVRRNSPISSIRTVRDLAPWRVGVQRGSVYEQWLTRDLVETGLMPATNLYAYPDARQAASDLQAGRLDVLVLDAEPATGLARVHNLQIAGQGLNRQLFAIAVRAGDTWLQERFNQVLLQLQNDGTIERLVSDTIGLDSDDQLPTPTPTPVPCIDGMTWVADLTYDDTRGAPQMLPGQVFRKGWRVRNSGNCAWQPSYTLTYAGGNVPAAQMGGRPVSVNRSVAPGAVVDLYVDLVAPQAPGTYRGYWQMVNDRGQAFGQRIWVTIAIAPPPTPTPTPVVTTIQFNVDRTNIRRGECVTFSWNVQNVSAVYFYRQGEDWQDNPATGQETRVVCPPYTSAHFLRVIKTNGQVDQRQITINVNGGSESSEPPPPPPPSPIDFRVDRTYIRPGECVTFSWSVRGARALYFFREGERPRDNPATGQETRAVCPPRTSAHYLQVIWPDNKIDTREITIYVGS